MLYASHMKRLLALAAIPLALLPISACSRGDSVSGCSEKIYHEGLLNMADKNRVVAKDLSVFKECDGLSKSDRTKARADATDKLLTKVFG